MTAQWSGFGWIRGYASIGFGARRDAAGVWSREIIELPSDLAAAALSGLWREDAVRLAYVSADRRASSVRQGMSYDGVELPSAWTQSSFDAVAAYSAIAVDASGATHLVYTAPADELPKLSLSPPMSVRYATVNDGQWTEPSTLSTEPGYYQGLSLVIDGDGGVHVSFSQTRILQYEPTLATEAVSYLALAPGERVWQRATLPTLGNARVSRDSLAVDADGRVSLAYCDLDAEGRSCTGLSLATRQRDTWSTETVDAGCDGLGALATLTLAADASPHLAYQGCDRELMYAHLGAR